MVGLEQHIGEILVGAFLCIFGLLAKASLTRLTMQNERILAELSSVSRDFQDHKVEDARALARIDAHLQNIYKRLDREHNQNGA